MEEVFGEVYWIGSGILCDYAGWDWENAHDDTISFELWLDHQDMRIHYKVKNRNDTKQLFCKRWFFRNITNACIQFGDLDTVRINFLKRGETAVKHIDILLDGTYRGNIE